MVSLYGNPKRSFLETVKVQSEFHWRSEDVSHARVTGYLPRRPEDQSWNQPMREKYVIFNKVERI